MESKAETFTVESYKARIGHYLARFRKETKYYSKAKALKLLMLKLHGELTILDWQYPLF
ncbi:MAG: hypothetical protein ACWIPJ_08035 [Polaribacter sp.]